MWEQSKSYIRANFDILNFNLIKIIKVKMCNSGGRNFFLCVGTSNTVANSIFKIFVQDLRGKNVKNCYTQLKKKSI